MESEPRRMTVYTAAIAAFKRTLLLNALMAHGGNCSAAARALQIHRNTLTRQMEHCGIGAQYIKDVCKEEAECDQKGSCSSSAATTITPAG
jgi:DNA-binding NtrC family response regulator